MWLLRFTELFATVVLLMLYVNVGESAVAAGIFKNAAYPGKCYINDNLILDEGREGKAHGFCGAYICMDGESGFTEVHTCAFAAPPPNCIRNAVNANAEYPHCCRINC